MSNLIILDKSPQVRNFLMIEDVILFQILVHFTLKKSNMFMLLFSYFYYS